MTPHWQRPTRQLIVTVLAALLSVSATASAPAQSVEIFSAGSLRTVVNAVAQEMRVAYNIEVKPTFGPSGTLRGRIENGESPDLFLSADLAAPRKLEAQGRTLAPVAVFARNRMCIVSRRSAGLTAANMVDRMLLKGVRLKTSTPVADPSGDYAWAIFDRIEALRPGAGRQTQGEGAGLDESERGAGDSGTEPGGGTVRRRADRCVGSPTAAAPRLWKRRCRSCSRSQCRRSLTRTRWTAWRSCR